MLDTVKAALGVTDQAFDGEISNLILAAKADLGIAGVIVPEPLDAIVTVAIITYCKLHFGSPPDFDRLKRSYDEQKGQLAMATGYTDWGDSD